jgi:hypothetical protein
VSFGEKGETMRIITASAILLAASATSAGAAPVEGAPACTATDSSLPAELAGWTHRITLAAAARPASLSQAKVAAATAYTVALASTSGVAYLVPPQKPGASDSYGGMVAFTAARAGTYLVALGAGAWVDMLGATKPVASIAHGHGPACSTIGKIVDFPLEPGRYTIQLAGSRDPSLAVLVARRP